eukprot:3373405-Prorocentrum_lima.AAC.1
MQQTLETRLLEEQNIQASALIEATSGHVREQQRTQEDNLRILDEECHREHINSQRTVYVVEERTQSLQVRMDETMQRAEEHMEHGHHK